MSMVDSYQPGAGAYHPHRKALPPGAAVHLPPRSQSPLVAIDPNPQHAGRTSTMTSHQQQQQQLQQQQYPRPTNTNPISHQAYMNQYNPTARRTLSNATTSTSSTGNGPARANSTSSSQLQRTTSSRSGSSPNSYVALMRKQKATVWCDRAQQEDPRLLAAQRAAKQRAAHEISSSSYHHASSQSNRTGTLGGVRSKMRGHHGGMKPSQYAPGLHTASGVPMRLSANEVDDDDERERNSDEERRLGTMSGQGRWHRRTESARSSLGSGSRLSMYGGGAGSVTPPASQYQQQQQQQQQQTHTTQHQPATFSRSSTEEHLAAQSPSSSFYGTPSRPAPPQERDSDDTDRENSFGGVGGLPQRFGQGQSLGEELGRSSQDDLKRRGSVDERTMTMSGYGRLFVANPDLDD